METDKRLIIIAGPNGSGKSTITEEIIKSPEFPGNYIAPDEVVKWSDFSEIQDNYKRYSAAMTFCQKVREYLLEQGQPLAFETVFSTPEKLEYLTNAKDLGYTTNVIFVSTENPQINIDRVAVRVSSGGHDVATDAVRQ